MSKKNYLDQYYTIKPIAKKFYNKVLDQIALDGCKVELMVEPSAGNGSFYSSITKFKKIGLDIAPKAKRIVKMDFFDYTYTKINKEKKVVVVGNPPFGKNSSLAVRFFNHSASFSDYICFILPRTFRKKSIHDRLNKMFSLIKDYDVPKNSFILMGERYDVPCCFQIWKRMERERRIVGKSSVLNSIFEFVKKDSSPDIAIRRVGGRTGKCATNVALANKNTHYFIKILDKSHSALELINVINSMDVQSIVNNTAGVRSISKGELLEKLKGVIPI